MLNTLNVFGSFIDDSTLLPDIIAAGTTPDSVGAPPTFDLIVKRISTLLKIRFVAKLGILEMAELARLRFAKARNTIQDAAGTVNVVTKGERIDPIIGRIRAAFSAAGIVIDDTLLPVIGSLLIDPIFRVKMFRGGAEFNEAIVNCGFKLTPQQISTLTKIRGIADMDRLLQGANECMWDYPVGCDERLSENDSSDPQLRSFTYSPVHPEWIQLLRDALQPLLPGVGPDFLENPPPAAYEVVIQLKPAGPGAGPGSGPVGSVTTTGVLTPVTP